ncbi:MotE family protein [Sagittula salina]|uniref:MotE family protein n=1 Tax=Sagittula salina TaxID=2820268 RepID=UPI001FD834E4|nr:hypothetical protein [Sagittula salina]
MLKKTKKPANTAAKASTGTKAASKPAKTRRRQKGALAAICALLVASALVRVGGIGASQAFAKDSPAAHDPAPAAHGPDQGTQLAAMEAPVITDADILPLMEALKAREARIEKREEDMDVRMQALSLAEQEIDRKLKALEAAETSLRQTMTMASDAAEQDITQLTDVYARMKPKQAAQLFEQMDPNFASGFLARMKPDSAAAIMAGMEPEKAYLISVILAGRNAEVPKD